ncbi:MAG: GerMN domain-containing protein [Bacilli bacterium]|nr:GerMN domain-containing protein [Bacilli bacterium]
MLKRFSVKKILVSLSVLITLLIIYLIPTEPEVEFKQELSYSEENVLVNDIYLIDSYEYVALTNVGIIATSVESQAEEILNILIQGGPGENKIPNGFKAIINSETTINEIIYDNKILKIDLSKELFDTNKEYEIKVLEVLVYSLTSLDKVDGLEIYIDGKKLTELPISKIKLPDILDKTFGINKEYDISNLKDINQVTIYYLNKYNDNYYYVPVTKYLNDNREKVSIIIDELSNNKYQSGLMSFMNTNTELVETMLEADEVILNFNQSIYNDLDNKTILSEVVKTINLSIEANYKIENVVYNVDSEPINLN